MRTESDLKYLSEIIDHSMNEIYIFDCESLKFSYVNQGALQNLGFSYEEMMDKTPIDLKPDYTEKDFFNLIKPLLDGSLKQLAFETVHERKDKSRYEVGIRLQLVKKEERNQIVVIALDVSEQIEARRDQQNSINRLKETERIAHLGGWKWDIRTNNLEWSDEVYRIFGEEPQSFKCTYKKFLSYLPKPEQKKVKEKIFLAMKNKTKHEVEYSILSANGETRYLSDRAEFEYDDNGKLLQLVGGVSDITDYVNLRTNLKEKEDLHSQLFHESSDGMMITDGKGHIIDYNQSLLDLLKLNSVDEFLNKQPFEFAPEYQPNGKLSLEMQSEILEKISLAKSQRFEWQIRQSDGLLNWVEILLTPVIIEGQYRTHSVWRDISERKLLQGELSEFNEELAAQVEHEVNKNHEQAHRMLQQSRLAQMGEMISMIAHQWRQPLASISAIAGTLSIDIELDDYKKDFFEENLHAISDLSLHLSSTINDFRGFFNEEKEKVSVNWKDLVESSLQIIEPSFSISKVVVHKDFADTSSVNSYQNEVRQVVLNIIKNAEDILIENKIAQPQVWIKSYVEEGYICLSIEDNAGGVPEDILDKVFAPYFSTKLKKDGTGLGLYMSKMIIEDNCGGSLKLENSDRGAMFIMQLPQSEMDAKS